LAAAYIYFASDAITPDLWVFWFRSLLKTARPLPPAQPFKLLYGNKRRTLPMHLFYFYLSALCVVLQPQGFYIEGRDGD